jgi:3-phytase
MPAATRSTLRRVLACGAVLAVLPAAVAGCGGGRDESGGEGAARSGAEPAARSDGEPAARSDGEPAGGGTGGASLTAARETEPVPSSGDAADDPAIWVDPARPERSVVVGSDKKGGIAVYDLSGRQLQYRPDGDMNSVDLRSGVPLGGRRVTLVTAGDRDEDTIAVYRLDPASRQLVPVPTEPIELGLRVYGSCMHRSARTGDVAVVVTSKDGKVEQWRLAGDADGRVAARRVRRLDVGGQTEGCVADDRHGALYLGEEDRGIWRYGAEPDAGARRTLVDATGDDGHLEADVEGLALAAGPRGTGLLVASSQGDDSFTLYRRTGRNAYVGRFEIAAGGGADAVTETDGIDVTTTPLGRAFPTGLFVAHDGDNGDEHQNYKLVPWPRDVVRRSSAR